MNLRHRIIMKRPEEPPMVVLATEDELYGVLGGYLELLPWPTYWIGCCPDARLFVNEDGRRLHLAPNIVWNNDLILVGPVLVAKCAASEIVSFSDIEVEHVLQEMKNDWMTL